MDTESLLWTARWQTVADKTATKPAAALVVLPKGFATLLLLLFPNQPSSLANGKEVIGISGKQIQAGYLVMNPLCFGL